MLLQLRQAIPTSGALTAPASSKTRWSVEIALLSSAAYAEHRSNQPTSCPLAKQAKPAPSVEPITVSGSWLLRAFLVVLGLALFCAYATLCLLFYQGQWQLVLHPSRIVNATPSTKSIPFEEIHFDYTETGTAQLDGWWIPSDKDARWSQSAILYLHDGNGSLSDCIDDLATLHSLGINIFVFDYRGYGHSTGIRPGEQAMTQDAEAAWRYLTSTRHIDSKQIIFYGAGIGATLAAKLAARQSSAGVILDNPNEPARQIIAADARARILPLSLLLTEHFDPSATLKSLTAPKLFLDRNGKKIWTEQFSQAAAFPKEYFELRQDSGYETILRRFFDEVLP
jgi:uncharacterized protein